MNADVEKAKEALKAKKAEMQAAKEALTRLEGEYFHAVGAVRKAQTKADELLPKCQMVSTTWRAARETDRSQVLILRRTPKGMLIVRRVGDADGSEFRFKWDDLNKVFRQSEKNLSTCIELHNVPSKYLPPAPELRSGSES